MPSPSSSLATQRPDLGASLEEFSLVSDRQGFIGHRVLPVMDVARQAGKFGIIPIEQLLQTRATRRAPGAGYSRGNWTFQPATYGTEEHGAEEPVDDRESEIYADYFDAELVSTERAVDAVLRNAEIRIAAAVFNATTWSATAITNEWDDYTNATPITDVEASVRRVWAACGLWPNALIINRKVFRNLRLCAQIVDKAKYQGFVNVQAGTITEQVLAQVFDLEEVIVAGSGKNSANEGQALSLAQIWSDEYAMVAKVVRSSDIREPGLGRTFHFGGDGSQVDGLIESYRDETVRSNVIRCRHDVDEKILYTEAADLMSNITT